MVPELEVRAIVSGRAVSWELIEVYEPALSPLVPFSCCQALRVLMTLHVYNNPTGDRTVDDGINVWVTEVPPDFTDDDVKYNIEQWANNGNEVAQLALKLRPGYWIDMSRHRGDATVRVYVDE